ncbi:MAG TPA: hypothetical protein DEB06_05140, partial [Phycisphaerales bacterium]|nr:hypothetical protein [Phycisphaerales bacterium]
MRRVSDRRNVFLALGLACGLSWPAGAPAQPQEPPPRAEQGPSDPPALLPLPRRRIGVDPGVDRDPLGLRPSPGDLVREGAFLLNRRGRVVQADDLTWVFVFDADAEGRAEPPMVLLPSLRLTELERLVASREETVTLRLSGMALVYRGRNYLLPTLFHTVADGAGPVDQNRGAAAPTPIQGESPKERGLDPEVDDLLKAMQRDEPQRRTVPPEGAGGTPPANAGAKEELAPLLREGTTVVARRGRVLRFWGVWWVFSL